MDGRDPSAATAARAVAAVLVDQALIDAVELI
jgi:hypothetical protein